MQHLKQAASLQMLHRQPCTVTHMAGTALSCIYNESYESGIMLSECKILATILVTMLCRTRISLMVHPELGEIVGVIMGVCKRSAAIGVEIKQESPGGHPLTAS